jgi:hypothetical protein
LGITTIYFANAIHSETETIWTLSGDQGDKWQQGRASIPDISSNIQVCFYSNHIQHINNIQTLDIAKYYINYLLHRKFNIEQHEHH